MIFQKYIFSTFKSWAWHRRRTACRRHQNKTKCQKSISFVFHKEILFVANCLARYSSFQSLPVKKDACDNDRQITEPLKEENVTKKSAIVNLNSLIQKEWNSYVIGPQSDLEPSKESSNTVFMGLGKKIKQNPATNKSELWMKIDKIKQD